MKTPLLVLAALLVASAAHAQDEEGSVDIGDVGSSRIGGPGLTKAERAYYADDEEDEVLTEETLPPAGHKKRIPGLLQLGKQYAGGQMWKDACEKYDQVTEEASEQPIVENETAKKLAGKSYVECARIAFTTGDFDRAEGLLKKSERLIGGSDHRHQGLRRKMQREAYRKKVSDGDISGALKLFNEFQAQEKNDDERIWFGEQLAARARAAHDSKDEITRNEMMRYLADVAPMNTEYRKLKEEIDSAQSVLKNALMFVLAAIAAVGLMGAFAKWRANAKLGGGLSAGKKNKFLDDEA